MVRRAVAWAVRVVGRAVGRGVGVVGRAVRAVRRAVGWVVRAVRRAIGWAVGAVERAVGVVRLGGRIEFTQSELVRAVGLLFCTETTENSVLSIF